MHDVSSCICQNPKNDYLKKLPLYLTFLCVLTLICVVTEPKETSQKLDFLLSGERFRCNHLSTLEVMSQHVPDH